MLSIKRLLAETNKKSTTKVKHRSFYMLSMLLGLLSSNKKLIPS